MEAYVGWKGRRFPGVTVGEEVGGRWEGEGRREEERGERRKEGEDG
jgi:hypothetical protein